MRYPGGVSALDNVSLEVYRDDLLIVLGPSGAGKSTLLRCLNRLVTPTSGRVLFRGVDVTRVAGTRLRRLRRRVGMVFQQFNLVGRLTVLENVLAGSLCSLPDPGSFLASHVRWFSANRIAAAMTALEHVGIVEKADQRADTLSGGQQQRVAIARVLTQDPEVVLADEPIASLDPASARVVMDTLQRIQQQRGIPVVVNLHQTEMARAYASRIVGMREGRVVFDGDPQQLDADAEAELYHRQATASSAASF